MGGECQLGHSDTVYLGTSNSGTAAGCPPAGTILRDRYAWHVNTAAVAPCSAILHTTYIYTVYSLSSSRLNTVLGCVLEGGEVGRLQFRLDRRLECRDPLGLGVLVLLMLFRCAPSGSSLSPSSSESR